MAAVAVSEQREPDHESLAESAEAPAPSTLTNKESPEEQNSSNKDRDVTSPRVQVSVTPNSGQPNVYPQAHAVYYGGYDNSQATWDEYPQFLYSEGMELGPHGTHPLIYHAGYGYSPQMPFGPYSPVATLPLVRRENHVYSSQEPHLSGPYFHQAGPNTMAYFNSHSPTSPVNSASSLGPGPSLFSNSQYFHDTWQSSDGYSQGGLWSDWLKSPDSLRPWSPLSPAVSPRPFGHGFSPFSSTMGYRRQRIDAAVNAVNSSMCSCDGPVDVLNEQNRGPRASAVEVKPTGARIDLGSYNKFDFKTDYDNARFFVIKSYSEDNVHKSIKYGVWASTPNGNRKLDAAFSESKDKGTDCPVFLLYSVNASAHFCGVAEMVGPVDFEKSVDYWQQDKWTGHFPVKWHVVKDVPNSLFRHIILENNDNKPVTNSRDTQEVKLEQGVEMLNIFKKHESLMSILDDFEFYEEREKMMEERKAHQRKQEQVQMMSVMSVGQLQKSFAEAVRLDEKKSKRKEETVTAEAGAGVTAEYFPNRATAAASTKGG